MSELKRLWDGGLPRAGKMAMRRTGSLEPLAGAPVHIHAVPGSFVPTAGSFLLQDGHGSLESCC